MEPAEPKQDTRLDESLLVALGLNEDWCEPEFVLEFSECEPKPRAEASCPKPLPVTAQRGPNSVETNRQPRPAPLFAKKCITSAPRSTVEMTRKEAIAIGLAKAREAGMNVRLKRRSQR